MNTGIDNIIDEGLDYFEDSEEDELIAFREMVQIKLTKVKSRLENLEGKIKKTG